jgi:hypothetical protein
MRKPSYGYLKRQLDNAVRGTDLFCYVSPAGSAWISRELLARYGMDLAAALLTQAEKNRRQVEARGLDSARYAQVEGLENHFHGQQLPTIHYLWFSGQTYITTHELLPYE